MPSRLARNAAKQAENAHTPLAHSLPLSAVESKKPSNDVADPGKRLAVAVEPSGATEESGALDGSVDAHHKEPSAIWPHIEAMLSAEGISANEIADHFERKATQVLPLLARIERAGGAHYGPGAERTRLWFAGAKPEKDDDGDETEIYPSVTDWVSLGPDGAHRYWIRPIGDRRLAWKDRRKVVAPSEMRAAGFLPIVVLSNDDVDDWNRQAMEHFSDAERPIYRGPGGTLVRPSLPVERIDSATGSLAKEPVELHEIKPSYLDLKVASLVRFFTIEPATGDNTTPRALIEHRPGVKGSRVLGWPKHFCELPEYPALQPLDGTAEFRYFTEAGDLVSEPGYNAASRRLFCPRTPPVALPVLPVVDHTTPGGKEALRQHAIALCEKVLAPFSQFPFETDADRSAYFALIVTALMRPALPTAPAFGLDATKPGSGKGKLSNAASLIGTGRAVSCLPWRSEKKEGEATLNSVLLADPQSISFDNVDSPIQGAYLDSILTTPVADARPLGRSEIVKVSTRKTFVFTGNDLRIIGDTNRRILVVRLVSRLADPSARTDFYIEDFDAWIVEHAAELNALLIGAIEAFRAAGMPSPDVRRIPFHSFDGAWTRWVRNFLLWLGLTDPCDVRKRLAQKDEGRALRVALFTALRDHARARAEKNPDASVGFAAHAIATFKEVEFPEKFFDGRANDQKVVPRKLKTFLASLADGRCIEELEGTEYQIFSKSVLGDVVFYVEPKKEATS